jgi:hypothetical protein
MPWVGHDRWAPPPELRDVESVAIAWRSGGEFVLFFCSGPALYSQRGSVTPGGAFSYDPEVTMLEDYTAYYPGVLAAKVTRAERAPSGEFAVFVDFEGQET